LANWQPEGPNLVEVVDGGLHVKTAMATRSGQFVWLRRDLPADFRVEYGLTPVSSGGFFLIFCAQGVNGEDIPGEKPFKRYRWLRDFKKYTTGPIDCYRISCRRGRMANCNLRENTGKRLLGQSRIDMVLPAGQTAHVALTKSGGRIRLVVNGKVFVDCTDDGSINGGVYGRGKTGLRQVYDSEGYYDNFKVFDLTAGP